MNPIFQTALKAKDILPEEQKYWHFINNVFNKKCQSFGCSKIDTPIFEYEDIYTKGQNTNLDSTTTQMYKVQLPDETKSERTIILRPEMTTGIIRSYIQHNMKNWPQPIKLYFDGQIFPYNSDKPDTFSSANQIGVNIIGDIDPFIDASLIFLCFQIMQKLGLGKDIIIDINSVGCNSCRVKMKKKLVEYFEKFLPTLCPDCNQGYSKNPLLVLNCKEEKCQKVTSGAPQLMDFLCTDCKSHFKSVLENLDNLQVPYNLNSKLVRNLDTYTKTVFEFFDSNDTDRKHTLMSGGRFDNLIKSFGQPSAPAIGFTALKENLIEKIKAKGIEIPEIRTVDICLVQIGEKAQKKCLPLTSELEEYGYDAICILGKESLKEQLRLAAKMKAKVALIIGQREVLDNSIIIRDMEDSSQETIKMSRLFELLEKKFK